MSNYYGEDNKFYQFIKEKAPNEFVFYENTISLMMSVDFSNDNARFMIIDDRSVGLSKEYKQKCKAIIEYIAKSLHIPVIWVTYSQEKKLDNNTLVKLCHYDVNETNWVNNGEIAIKEMATIINQHISRKTYVRNTPKTVSKAYNTKPSSGFHEWQRDYWETNGYIIDIDLIRIEPKTQRPLNIYELKRSYTDYDVWLPYSADKRNYYSQAKICDILGVKFNVLFNHQNKNNGIIADDISEFKVFDVYHKIGEDYSENTLFIKFVSTETPEQIIGKVNTATMSNYKILPDGRTL